MLLDQLVTSNSRRELLKLLWTKNSGSVSELSRLGGVSFTQAHRELMFLLSARLASAERFGNTVVYSANFQHPHAELLEALVTADPSLDESSDDRVRGWLKALGAPLTAPSETKNMPRLEDALVAGLQLAHRDATATRAFPVCLHRQWPALDRERLLHSARRAGEQQTLGFFLDLTGDLSKNAEMKTAARKLRDHRVSVVRSFFRETESVYARKLAEMNTPAAAQKWKFRMNLGMDAFEDLFRKFVPK